MRVSIIGSGYVGLVSGACLAEKGHEIICVDVDQERVDRLNSGLCPIHESGLEDLLRKHVGRRLRATVELRTAILESEVSLICVGTPFNGESIELNFVRAAARDIGGAMRSKRGFHTVVVKSTVVPGTTASVVVPILEVASGMKAGQDFGVGMNPEFLREGCAVSDFMHPDRIVLGAIDRQSASVLDEIYLPFEGVDKVRTTTETAEMIKYTANALLATLISFANEVGNLCSTVKGVDALDVMRGVHLDKRLSPLSDAGKRITPEIVSYLVPGCGFGGSCFPKDLKALIAFGRESGIPMRLLESVIAINQAQPARIVALLEKHFSSLAGMKIAVLGVAFKPGTDDVRESPSLSVLRELLGRKARVIAYDPVVKQGMLTAASLDGCAFAKDLETAIEGADAIIVMTRWPQFEVLPKLIETQHNCPVIIDGRRMLSPSSVSRYEGIGMGRKEEIGGR